MHAPFELSVRTKRINAFCKRLAWCCGTAADLGTGTADGIDIQAGCYVNVCLHVGMTAVAGGGPAEQDMRALARQTAKMTAETHGSLLVVKVLCERREIEKNKRGAVVLHGIAYLGATVTHVYDSDDEYDDVALHSEDKTCRHDIFADWIVECFQPERLVTGTGVLDVAAGKGALSAALCKRVCDLKCNLVEPVSRDGGREGSEFLCQDLLPEGRCQFYEEHFDAEQFPTRHSEVVEGCSAMFGMHPDQATESIVDLAVKLNKPFAVVPCCVFPTLFPNRRLFGGQGVVSYGSFLKYLKGKDVRIQSTRLPFKGRNKVLYMNGD